MATVIARTNIKKQKGYLYFVDKNGNVASVPMKRGGSKKNKNTPQFMDGVKKKKRK